MQMPMQIGLDELLSMVMARMEGMAMAEESLKTKFNVLARALYRKGLLTDEDVVEALREEYRILKELGVTGEVPGEDMIKAVFASVINNQEIMMKAANAIMGIQTPPAPQQGAPAEQPQPEQGMPPEMGAGPDMSGMGNMEANHS